MNADDELDDVDLLDQPIHKRRIEAAINLTRDRDPRTVADKLREVYSLIAPVAPSGFDTRHVLSESLSLLGEALVTLEGPYEFAKFREQLERL